MPIPNSTNRREFLKTLALTGGGLVLGIHAGANTPVILSLDSTEELLPDNVSFNSYLSIGTDNIITLWSPNPELGQNIKTSFPAIVADELDADWKLVKVLQAPLDTRKFERQLTGGSGAIPHSWERLRRAGATARWLLREAAARRWKVDSGLLITQHSEVVNPQTQAKFTYGELAVEASTLTIPQNISLKSPEQFKLIGTALRNVENRNIATGKPLFGLDFYREGMRHAVILRPRAFGMKLKSVDSEAARQIPGVTEVVVLRNSVAVVGNSTWQVLKGRKALKVEYEPEKTIESTQDHQLNLRKALDSTEAQVRRKDGDVATAFAKAAKTIVREYECPFLPHNPMEPMNFFAHVREDGVELVGPTQTPDLARNETARLLGISPDKITVEITRLGGGFGRRLKADYVLEAAELSSRIKAPVKVTWTREDDMGGGSYRPAVRYRFEAALDSQGALIGYKLRGVGINSGNPTREDNFPSGAVDHLLIDSVELTSPITTGAWRAPITNFLAYAEQSFLDEVAEAAGKDPVEFRLELLRKAKEKPVGAIRYDIDRMTEVIQLAAEKSGWKSQGNRALGFSVYFSHRSYVAQVAEAIYAGSGVTIKHITAVADCGIVVNTSGALHQVKGGIVDGMGHALFGKLTFTQGAPDQLNFNTYKLIRMRDIPAIDVYFVNNGKDPTGLGEPALPPTGGAIANAVYKLTGKRLYEQPFQTGLLAQEKLNGQR